MVRILILALLASVALPLETAAQEGTNLYIECSFAQAATSSQKIYVHMDVQRVVLMRTFDPSGKLEGKLFDDFDVIPFAGEGVSMALISNRENAPFWQLILQPRSPRRMPEPYIEVMDSSLFRNGDNEPDSWGICIVVAATNAAEIFDNTLQTVQPQ